MIPLATYLKQDKEPVLLVESGGTKSSWLYNHQSTGLIEFDGAGLNPNLIPDHEIRASLDKTHTLLMLLAEELPRHVFFYGAGLGMESSRNIMAHHLKELFQPITLHVNTDLHLTSEALLGNKGNGLIGILGTGAGLAIAKEGEISVPHRSKGYYGGDEGSGSYLGKRLLEAALKEEIPGDIILEIRQLTGKSAQGFYESLGNEQNPAERVARLTPILAKYQAEPWANDLIEKGFSAYCNTFLKKEVLDKEQLQDKTIHFTGGVAYHFRKKLAEVLHNNGWYLGKVYPSATEAIKRTLLAP